MKGLELSEKYFEEFGKSIFEGLEDVYARSAIGLVGDGSECLGFDDDVSLDHDFEPGFCVWLNSEDYEKYSFKLERAYMKLPKEFMGYKRQPVAPAGGARHGIFEINEFYSRFLGDKLPLDTTSWLNIEPHYLKTASSGKVFVDNLGEFTKIRNTLNGYPEDVRLKKIAAHSILMNQSGQYNYARLISRGETGAAQLAIMEFVKHAISVIYLLNNAYEPFYKWAYKGMRNLEKLSDLEIPLTFLTETGNSAVEAQGKAEIIDDIARAIITEYKEQGITKATCNNLDTHAYSIQETIKDGNLRNSNIFIGA